MRSKRAHARRIEDKPGRDIEVEKNLKRWNFVLSGQVSVGPVHNEEGDIAYMILESDEHFAKCRDSEELNIAMDIAIYKAEFLDERTEWAH